MPINHNTYLFITLISNESPNDMDQKSDSRETIKITDCLR